MLGLQFPCGKALEQLARQAETVPDQTGDTGVDCCLSGLENQCRKSWSRVNRRQILPVSV
ncbi:MAG: hypothetical protein ACLSFT_00665 [Ruminococcus callidus]